MTIPQAVLLVLLLAALIRVPFPSAGTRLDLVLYLIVILLLLAVLLKWF